MRLGAAPCGTRRPRLGGFRNFPPPAGAELALIVPPTLFLILWRRLVLALRASAPTVAASCGRGPASPPLFSSGGPGSPPPRPRSLRSRPATVVGASGDRCPASRGSFVGYRLASFAGAFRCRSCVRRAGRVLRAGRDALGLSLPLVALLLGRPAHSFARAPALRPLRPRYARPRPRFSLQGVRVARR